jgi:glycerol-3-phosphate O-acyltransferase
VKEFEARLKALHIDQKYYQILSSFYNSYRETTLAEGYPVEEIDRNLNTMVDLVIKEFLSPHKFDSFNRAERESFDYYKFGNDFIRPLIQKDKSSLRGKEYIPLILKQLGKKENVILLANHQIEPDPQIISLMLEEEYPKLAEDLIVIAGHRVVTDPLAIPFSRGINLLSIYSKRYLENPPELREEKHLHNQKTLSVMKDLLMEGGKMIYVAPSGGRDRRDEEGNIAVAPFDPSSIELFNLMSQQAHVRTHFYPFAMSTYHILPPPDKIQTELGEQRIAKVAPVHLAFGEPVDMDIYEVYDKKTKREKRAESIWNEVRTLYAQFPV